MHYRPGILFSPTRWPTRAAKALLCLLFAVTIFQFTLAASAFAQQEAAPAAPAPGQAPPPGSALNPLGNLPNLRAHFVILDQYSYDEHPFYQITGSSGYKGGKAALSAAYYFEANHTDGDEDLLTRLIHNLPPFTVDVVRPLDMFLPKGLAFGFSYMNFSQTDTAVASSGSSVLGIQMDTYMYVGHVKFYAFDPTQPGLNYYLGFGAGILEGKIGSEPYTSDKTSYSQTPFGMTVMGLETKGENIGFRYELNLINADKVHLVENLYGQSKEIDFSGSIIRMSLFYEFKN